MLRQPRFSAEMAMATLRVGELTRHILATLQPVFELDGGSLTFVKTAVPQDGSDFFFDLSGPTNPTTPTFLNK